MSKVNTNEHSPNDEYFGSDKTNNDPIYNIGAWDDVQKKFFKQMLDKAKCYIWLYDSSYRLYKTLWLAHMIPILFITTVSGVANLGQLGFRDSESDTVKIIYPIVMSTLNIIAAILTSLVQYFKIADQKEIHLRAQKDWQQFGTDLELLFFSSFSIEVRNRKFSKILIRYKQLLEKSPSIPKVFLKSLYSYYGNKDVYLPEIIGEIKFIMDSPQTGALNSQNQTLNAPTTTLKV